MKKYTFWKVIPSGNPTIFFKADEISPRDRIHVANFAMSSLHIGAEQAGFISFGNEPRMEMAGGEFCLNATRSFALLLAQNGCLKNSGQDYFGSVSVSGVPFPLKVRVILGDNSLPYSEACLSFPQQPIPERIFFEEEEDYTDQKLFMVRLPGITHLIFKEWETTLTDEFCLTMCQSLQLTKESAVGFLQISGEHCEGEQAAFNLSPFVWVRDTNTLCHETACGSGTLAASLSEFAWSGIRQYSVLQPSGEKLNVRIEQTKTGFDVWVGGIIRIAAEGFTDLTGVME